MTLSNTNLTATAGDSATLEISFVANPMPVFTVNFLLPNATTPKYTITDSVVMFMGLEESNTGNYSLQGMNFAGTRNATFQLTVEPCECIIRVYGCITVFSMCEVAHSPRKWTTFIPKQYGRAVYVGRDGYSPSYSPVFPV